MVIVAVVFNIFASRRLVFEEKKEPFQILHMSFCITFLTRKFNKIFFNDLIKNCNKLLLLQILVMENFSVRFSSVTKNTKSKTPTFIHTTNVD